MAALAPLAVNPLITASQAVLSQAENLQRNVNKTFRIEDEDLRWKLIGTNYILSVSLPNDISASYTFNATPRFRSVGPQFHHLFFTKVIAKDVAIFTCEETTYKKLQNLMNKSWGANTGLNGNYCSESSVAIEFVATLAVPYSPVPGKNKMTAEYLSEVLTNFLDTAEEMKKEVDATLQANKTYKQLTCNPQDGPIPQRELLPQLDGLINDNFEDLANLWDSRIGSLKAFEATLEKDKQFPATVKIVAFATSALGSEQYPYAPEFCIEGKDSQSATLTYGSYLAAPSEFMSVDQNQALGTFYWCNAGAEQLLPKEGRRQFKSIPALNDMKAIGIFYSDVQTIQLTSTSIKMLEALKLFRESCYGVYGIVMH